MNCALKVNNVSKKAKDFQILHNVSFELEKGEIVGLIGPNGAGKTSIMKILVGLTRNYTGEVDLTAVKDIGCMIETPNFYPYSTGYQNLMYFAGLNGVGKQKVEELLKLLGLWDAAHKHVVAHGPGRYQVVEGHADQKPQHQSDEDAARQAQAAQGQARAATGTVRPFGRLQMVAELHGRAPLGQ